jgi:HK97 gp10 family phage protein
MNEIKFNGLDKVLGKINSIGNPEAMRAALGKACALVEAAAKQKAPKDNGELRRSIASRIEGFEGIVYTPLEYAPYVEYGTGLFAEEGGRRDVPWHYQDDEGEWHSTSGQHPQPYMRPALNDNRAQIINILKEGLEE